MGIVSFWNIDDYQLYALIKQSQFIVLITIHIKKCCQRWTSAMNVNYDWNSTVEDIWDSEPQTKHTHPPTEIFSTVIGRSESSLKAEGSSCSCSTIGDFFFDNSINMLSKKQHFCECQTHSPTNRLPNVAMNEVANIYTLTTVTDSTTKQRNALIVCNCLSTKFLFTFPSVNNLLLKEGIANGWDCPQLYSGHRYCFNCERW